MNFAMGLCVRCDFGQPVCSHFSLCSCVAKEFVWYDFFWRLLVLGWWLDFGVGMEAFVWSLIP